jgi:hypothetical protein
LIWLCAFGSPRGFLKFMFVVRSGLAHSPPENIFQWRRIYAGFSCGECRQISLPFEEFPPRVVPPLPYPQNPLLRTAFSSHNLLLIRKSPTTSKTSPPDHPPDSDPTSHKSRRPAIHPPPCAVSRLGTSRRKRIMAMTTAARIEYNDLADYRTYVSDGP